MTLKEILKLVLGWRLLIILIAFPAMFLLVPRTKFTNLTPTPSASNIFSMWSNFDGTRYLHLAEFGYGYQHKTNTDYSFFPVFPWFVKTLNFMDNYLASGLFVSHLSLILALYYLYKLVVIDFKAKIAKSAIYTMLFFPTAFFFGSVYPESLFLLLVVLSFYLARKNRFFLACITAAIASASGITGLFLWPALIYEYWLVNGKNFKKCLNSRALWLTLPPLGLWSFLRFQIIKTGGLYLFAPIDKLILIHQVFFRYFKMFIFTDHWDPLFFTIVLESFCAVLVLLVLVFSLKKIRFSYWLFTFLSFLLPTFSGSFMSFPRFILTMFPVFIFLALWLEKQHPFLRLIFYSLCFVGSVYSIVLFTRGYFIA